MFRKPEHLVNIIERQVIVLSLSITLLKKNLLSNFGAVCCRAVHIGLTNTRKIRYLQESHICPVSGFNSFKVVVTPQYSEKLPRPNLRALCLVAGPCDGIDTELLLFDIGTRLGFDRKPAAKRKAAQC